MAATPSTQAVVSIREPTPRGPFRAGRRPLLLIAATFAVSASLSAGCEPHTRGPVLRSQEPFRTPGSPSAFVHSDTAKLLSEAPRIRPVQRVYYTDVKSEVRTNEVITARRNSSAVLTGMVTSYVVMSPTEMSASVWNGCLHEGQARLNGGDLAGSVALLSGELYVEAAPVTAPPPTTVPHFPSAFPIVVTTSSGGIGAGSVGTAWYCWCRSTDSGPEYYFVLLDNPPANTYGALHVGKEVCWTDPTEVTDGTDGPRKLVLTELTKCIRVRGDELDRVDVDTVPGLRDRIDHAKQRAITVGLREGPAQPPVP